MSLEIIPLMIIAFGIWLVTVAVAWAIVAQLRAELALQVTEARAREATAAALREELAEAQARLAKLHEHKKSIAAHAAGAIAEMAEQVLQLTDAMCKLKQENDQQRRPAAA